MTTELDVATLASALLNIAPKLLRRINADIPLTSEDVEGVSGLHDVSELRATPGQLALLQILVEHQRCTMQELAEHLAVTPSTVTAMVKRLLVQGYVERSHDTVDWRTVWVYPTERGLLAVTVYERARCSSLQQRLERLSEEDRRAIAASLPALQHLMET